MKEKGHIQSFNEHQENLNISDVIQSLSLLKGRIQVERLLDKLNDNVV